jgi:HlyD family secretion protein
MNSTLKNSTDRRAHFTADRTPAAQPIPAGYTQSMPTHSVPATHSESDLSAVLHSSRPRRRWWVWLLFVTLAGATVAMARNRMATAKPTTAYITAPVTRGVLSSTVTATGNLRARGVVNIGSEISGRVKHVATDFNRSVKKGEVLAELDATQAEASLRQSRAQLAAAQADLASRLASLNEAQRALERTATIASQGMTSVQQLDADKAHLTRAEAAVAAARSQVELQRAAVLSAQTTVDKTRIRSPLDGVVLTRDLEVGQTVTAATPAFTVALALSKLEAVVSIDEADIGRVQPGQTVSLSVDAWPGKQFAGVLREVHDVATTKNAVVTYNAIVTINNETLTLKPGMSVTVTIEAERREGVVLVPNAALRYRPAVTVSKSAMSGPPDAVVAAVLDGKARLYLLEGGQPKEMLVNPGATDGVSTEIRSDAPPIGAAVIVDAEVQK